MAGATSKIRHTFFSASEELGSDMMGSGCVPLAGEKVCVAGQQTKYDVRWCPPGEHVDGGSCAGALEVEALLGKSEHQAADTKTVGRLHVLCVVVAPN
jgi:hypothetical protein